VAHTKPLNLVLDAKRAIGRRRRARPVERHRLRLALQLVRAGVLVEHGGIGGAFGHLAGEHGAGRGGRLDSQGGVDEVARDHSLARGADRDGGLAGEHAPRALAARVELGDRGNQLEHAADCALGVVLLRDRRPQTAISASPMNFSIVPA
jgi:hypothetical protein